MYCSSLGCGRFVRAMRPGHIGGSTQGHEELDADPAATVVPWAIPVVVRSPTPLSMEGTTLDTDEDWALRPGKEHDANPTTPTSVFSRSPTPPSTQATPSDIDEDWVFRIGGEDSVNNTRESRCLVIYEV